MIFSYLEGVAKLPHPEKSMILNPVASVANATRALTDEPNPLRVGEKVG